MIDIIKFETTKIIRNKSIIGGVFISVLVMLGIFYVGYYQSQTISSERHATEDQIDVNKKIKDEYEGDLSNERIEMILNDYMSVFQDEPETKHNFYPFYWDIAQTFFPTNYDVYLAMNAAEKENKLTTHDINLKKVEDIDFQDFEKPLKVGNYVPWNDLYQVTSYLFVLSSLISIIVCSLVFAEDVSKNITQLLLTTKYGPNKMILSKVITGSFISIFIFSILQMINYLVFSFLYDTSGWDSSIQTNFKYQLFDFPIELNHLQIYLISILIHLVGLTFVIGITLFISACTKTSFSALAITLGLFFLPEFLINMVNAEKLKKLLQIFPINHFNIQNLLGMLGYEGNFFFPDFYKNIFMLAVFLLLMKFLFDSLSYSFGKKWRIP